jgi:hypothetical protein
MCPVSWIWRLDSVAPPNTAADSISMPNTRRRNHKSCPGIPCIPGFTRHQAIASCHQSM